MNIQLRHCNHEWEWKRFECCQRKVCVHCGKILMDEQRPVMEKIELVCSHVAIGKKFTDRELFFCSKCGNLMFTEQKIEKPKRLVRPDRRLV